MAVNINQVTNGTMMMDARLEELMSKLIPASDIKKICRENKTRQVQAASAKVKQFIDSVMEPTLKYIDSMIRSCSVLTPEADYIQLMYDNIFKQWLVTIEKSLYAAFNESRGVDYCKNLSSMVTDTNFPVKAVNIVLEQLEPVLESRGYRLKLCMSNSNSKEYDCCTVIWGQD